MVYAPREMAVGRIRLIEVATKLLLNLVKFLDSQVGQKTAYMSNKHIVVCT